MNIGIISENRKGYISGGRWYPWYIGYALANHGHNVKMITNNLPMFDEEFKDFPGKDNVTIIEDRNFLSKNLRAVKDIDVFIGSPIAGADYAVAFSRMFNRKSVVLCYEPHNWITGSIKKNVESNAMYWEDYIKVSKRCDLFLCNAELPSNFAKTWIPEISDKVDYLFNGINSIVADKTKLVPDDKRENAAVYVGRIDEHKRIYDIFEVMSLMKEKIEKVYFVTGYIAEEDNKKILEWGEKLNVEIELKKCCSTNEKFDIIAKSRFVWIPTHFEGFGLPLAEAMYLKTPVVCYPLDIFKEVYKEYPNYLDISNYSASANILDEYLSDKEKFYENTNDAKNHVASFASVDNFVRNFESKVLEITVKNKDSKPAMIVEKKIEPRFNCNASISFVVPIYNHSVVLIDECMQSILNQSYQNFEVVVVKDGIGEETEKYLEKFKDNEKFVFVNHKTNKGIPESLTDGIKKAKNDIIALVDDDDILNERAAEYVAYAFETEKADIVYTNETGIDKNGKKIHEVKKPDWSIDLLLQCQYINHLCAYKNSFLKSLMPCNQKYGGSWDYDLLLRASEKNPKVSHVSNSLYKWRRHDGNAGNDNGVVFAHKGAELAIRDYLKRNKLEEKIEIDSISQASFEVRHEITREPKVLLIIPFVEIQMFANAMDYIRKNTVYENYDIAAIYHRKNGDFDDRVESYAKDKVKYFYKRSDKFNFSQFNNDVFDSVGKKYKYIVLFNDDILVNKRWLTELIAAFSHRWKKVGIVGAKLLLPNHCDNKMYNFPDNWYCDSAKIQHAGVRLLKDHAASHMYKNRFSNWLAANYIRPMETVTFGLVAIDAKCYGETRLNPKYSSDLNDMDFCIRARKRGWEIVYNPGCVAFHLESITRFKEGNAGSVTDQNAFREEYKELLEGKINYRQMISIETEGL